MSAAGVIVVIEYQARASEIEAARAALQQLIEVVVREEPNCFGIRLHQGTDDPARILLWEAWTDQAAFTGPHMETPHLTAFRARAPELFIGPPTVSFWVQQSDVVR